MRASPRPSRPLVPGESFLLLAANSLDMLDGAVARTSGRASPFGAFLDFTLDRYAEIVVFIGLLGLVRQPGQLDREVLTVLALAGSLMVSYTRARAEGLGLDGEVGCASPSAPGASRSPWVSSWLPCRARWTSQQ